MGPGGNGIDTKAAPGSLGGFEAYFAVLDDPCRAALSKRCSYYFIWALSEAGLNAAGFGFNGFKDGQEGKQMEALYDRYTNAEIYAVRTARVCTCARASHLHAKGAGHMAWVALIAACYCTD